MSTKSSGKLTIALIALAFFGPMAIAVYMYYSGQDVELGANNGALLEPIVNLVDTLPESELAETAPGKWRLVYANEAACDEACRDALYTTRQSRKMLGREMDRVERIFLHGDSAPDTLFINQEHAGLVTFQDGELVRVLENKRPEALPAGGFYLVDPLGNLVLYFEPGINPKDMVADIKRLLRISQIG